ncbi:MAG: nucleotide exchange factor GrpE [Thermoflexibacteraceae bacterium]|jgi:molecular chaperone GrpE
MEDKNTHTENVEQNNNAEDLIQRKDTEIGELKEKFMRLYADFENFRRRTAKEKLDLQVTANESLILALLPILDDFERAKKTFTDDIATLEPVKQGFDLIHSKMFRVLEQKGVKPIQAIGEVFNSELHEAITQIPAPTPDQKGKVIDEVEKGYYLGEKVIRFSKVIIGA